MSWKASAWAKEQRLGSPAAKSILLCLADYADPEKAQCWPSQAQLASDAEVSERTAREWLQRLEDWGLIDRTRRSRASGARASDLIVLNLASRVVDGAERCREIKENDGEEADSLPAEFAGRTNRQSDPDLPAADDAPTGNQRRASKEEPSMEPPNGTSQPGAQARERGAFDQDRGKKIDAEGWALLRDWPGFAGMPKEPALKVWRQLSDEERERASRRFAAWLALLKSQAKSHVPAPSTYFGQRLFDEVADPADAPPGPVHAAPFGKLWGGVRMAELLCAPEAAPAPNRFMAEQLALPGEAGLRARLARQAKYGWPRVNAMHDRAANAQGVSVSPDLERLGALTEPVRVGTDLFEVWRAEHERRGWPWLPPLGRVEWVYFPKGGPAGLGAFEQAVNGARQGDDGDRHEAAE